MSTQRINPVFVEYVPANLEQGDLYISIEYATATHLCCCGCANKVVTPFSPTDWQFCFDGESVSLSPSIGNWSFPCGSHYWIKCNEVRWAPKWSRSRVNLNRQDDRATKEAYFGRHDLEAATTRSTRSDRRRSPWQRLVDWLRKTP